MLKRPRKEAYEKIAKIIAKNYGSEILCNFIEQPQKNGWVTIYAMNKETDNFLFDKSKDKLTLISVKYRPINIE